MEEDMEKQVSSLDNLYDDFDDFDLGQIVEKLKEETKMLKNCINEQNKDIDKLANTIVELKTTNEKLSDNISSLYSTAKAEIERKNKIIADLQREKDNLTFRRMERYNQNITSSIPQNKNIGLHSETSEHLESQNNTVVRVKQEITDNEHVPKYNSNIYGNTEGNTHMLNMFQERNKQDRNLFNNNNSELHVPYFDNESDSRQSKKIDTNLRIKKRSRSRSWDNKDYGNARQKMKSIDRSPDRSDRSNVNNWHKHHRRDSSNDRRRDKFYDQRRSKSGHRRDKSDHRRDKSNHRYKEERDEFVDGSKRDYLEDTFPRRFDSKSDNSYGRYERSTYGKINYCSPEIKTEQSLNDLKSHKSTKEDSYEDNKKIKRKKCREDTKSGNSDKKILENNCDEKQNSTIITGTTDIALNKNRELIKYTKDLDNINLTTPVESLNNKFEILKPQQKYKKSLYKETAKEKNNIDKINQKDKKEDLKLDNKHNAITENVSVDDVLNSGEIHQSIKSNPNECDKLENMKEHENENKSDKIIIVSDIMILPNTLSNQDPRENKIQFEKVEGESKEVNAKMGSPKLHLVKMNSSKLISDKEILDESGSKEITNFDGGNSKELGENTLDQICEKEITSSDHNEVEKVIPYEGNVQHCKKKLSDEVNPPKERTHNLDSLEDQHSSLNSEKDISQDNIDKIESPQSTPSRKSSVNAKNKMSHPPTRRSQRISCKEMKKINTSIEENDDQKVKNDTLKDKTSFVKNVNNKNQIDTMQVKATDSKINSEDQKSIIEQLVNERIKYLNINKTEQHGNDISPGNIVPNTSKILHTKTGNKLSPVNTPTDKNSLSQTVLQNESIEKVCTKQIISSPVSLNKTPENNKEVTKTRRRITPTPVKDDPVCSFKNILSRNNTMKLFSKTVAIETNLTEENNIPILHLEEINLSNMEEGTQKTFDKSIAKLLDCMNVSNLDCDISTASLSPKVNLTFENIINTNTDPPADLNSKAAVDRSIEAVPEEITPKKQFSTRLVSSTPKVERQTSQTIGFGKDIASTDQNNVPSTNVGSDEHCKVTNNQIDKKVPCKNVNRPGRFRRRCRIIAVIKDGNQWRLC